MVDELLHMMKFCGAGGADFGRWKTKMIPIGAIKGEFDQTYSSCLPVAEDLTAQPPIMANTALENQKKNQLAWNYLIMALEGPPLQVILNITSRDPHDAQNELLSIYEPATTEACSHLLQEMENCNLEDNMGSPEVWFYKLDLINCRIGDIDPAYKKTDIQMIVHITSKLPRDLYQSLIMAYSLSGFTGVTLLTFHKKVVEFWQSNIKPRLQGKINVTMMASEYASMPCQVQAVQDNGQGKEKGCNDKLDELIDLLCKMLASNCGGPTEDKKPPATQSQANKIISCSNCGKLGHGIANCWEKGGGKEVMRPNPTTIKCKRCREMGHFASQCPTKQNKETQKMMHIMWLDKEEDSYNNEEGENLFIGTIKHNHYYYRRAKSGKGLHQVVTYFDEDSNKDKQSKGINNKQPNNKMKWVLFNEDSNEEEDHGIIFFSGTVIHRDPGDVNEVEDDKTEGQEDEEENQGEQNSDKDHIVVPPTTAEQFLNTIGLLNALYKNVVYQEALAQEIDLNKLEEQNISKEESSKNGDDKLDLELDTDNNYKALCETQVRSGVDGLQARMDDPQDVTQAETPQPGKGTQLAEQLDEQGTDGTSRSESEEEEESQDHSVYMMRDDNEFKDKDTNQVISTIGYNLHNSPQVLQTSNESLFLIDSRATCHVMNDE